ncbi:MAG: hypothetical protein KIS81_10530 [Maricaulaceae bacterium]|nr:hypothetical protein [Maricaulaceae bacterium]
MLRSAFAAAVLVAVATFATFADDGGLDRPAPWAEVMLLGTYHFANPGLDTFNTQADDVLSEHRQREIETLTARLAEWAPDLILVEWPRTEQARVQALYEEYRAGGLRDRRNEVIQIGFRLADMLGHDRVATTDVQHAFYSEQQREVAAAPNPRNQALHDAFMAYGEALQAQAVDLMESETIGGILARMNTPEALAANSDFYMRFHIRHWQDENQGGAHTIANWYARNILIFQNMLREVEESEGRARRVLAIYGQGHVPILAHLIEATPYLTLADPLPYLAE